MPIAFSEHGPVSAGIARTAGGLLIRAIGRRTEREFSAEDFAQRLNADRRFLDSERERILAEARRQAEQLDNAQEQAPNVVNGVAMFGFFDP